ncbi:MAG: thermonuclease family protein [Planctomycetaceae bacterium]
MARRNRTSTTDFVNGLRRSRAPRWLIVVVVVIVLAVQYFSKPENGDAPPVDTTEPDQTYVVKRVVDGDTLLLDGGERVRLLGVDTPETVREDFPVELWGPEASQFTKRMVEGRSVQLKFDKERRDRHGRLLAYVYIDGVLLNEELIRAGLSKAQLQYPYSSAMKRLFREAEDDAKTAGHGLWSQSARESRDAA